MSFRAQWIELRALVNQYRLVPEAQRDDDAKRRLLARVDEMVTAESGNWAARRRKLNTPGPASA